MCCVYRYAFWANIYRKKNRDDDETKTCTRRRENENKEAKKNNRNLTDVQGIVQLIEITSRNGQ